MKVLKSLGLAAVIVRKPLPIPVPFPLPGPLPALLAGYALVKVIEALARRD